MTYQNIRDVLALPEVQNGKLWFRPVTWKRSALCCVGLSIVCAPQWAVRSEWYPRIDDFLVAWETVTPDQVLAERQT